MKFRKRKPTAKEKAMFAGSKLELGPVWEWTSDDKPRVTRLAVTAIDPEKGIVTFGAIKSKKRIL